MEKELKEEIYRKLIQKAAGKSGPAILAIDGRCASGKTTLGNELAAEWNASLFHMDDFYLQPHQRTKERLAEPGGNVDRERFLEEVLLPLENGQSVSYRRFDCSTFTFEPARLVEPAAVSIVEGSYACHPELRDHYDLRIFMNIGPDEQMKRITKRNGPEAAKRFRTIWIPLEETYFNSCGVRGACDYELFTDRNQ